MIIPRHALLAFFAVTVGLSACAVPVPPKQAVSATKSPTKDVVSPGAAVLGDKSRPKTCPVQGNKKRDGQTESCGSSTKTGTITLGTNTYTLGGKLGKGGNGEVYSLINEKDPKVQYVAKKLQPGSFSQKDFADVFALEVKNTKAVQRYTDSGQSQISRTGDSFFWIITHKVEGGSLTNTAHYQATAKAGAPGCKAYLEGIHAKFIKQVMELRAKSGLVHLDSSDSNTFWLADGQTFSGFIDFGAMTTLKSDKSASEFAAQRANYNWPIPVGCT